MDTSMFTKRDMSPYFFRARGLSQCGRLGRVLRHGLLLAFFLGTPAWGVIPASERSALLDFYVFTHGDGWANVTGWNGPAGTECTWYGVTCDPGGTSVTGINLSGNLLAGSLPPLTAFTNLQLFNVGLSEHFANAIRGRLPSLQGLSKLQTFMASGTQFTGSIPSFAGLAALTYVDVNGNQLSGAIPDLAAAPDLAYFRADGNKLTGSIPDLSALSSLGYFSVSSNQLSGQIPSLNSLSSLTRFSVGENLLTGPIPALSGLTKLQVLELSFNRLTGVIPSLSGLTDLQYFSVSFNLLSGPAPDLTGLANLSLFEISGNQLTGPVPAPASPLVITTARLCPNLLTPASVPPSAIDQVWNSITGMIPWSQQCGNAPAVSISSTSSTATFVPVGTPITFTDFIYAGPNPGGTVTFTSHQALHSGVLSLCENVPVVAGVATCTTNVFQSGSSDIVTATYSGDADDAPDVNSDVNPQVSELLIETSSANPASAGQPVDLQAVLIGGAATDVVTFYDGNVPLCAKVPVMVVNGALVAHCVVTFTGLGNHSLTINQFDGDDNSPIIETITAGPNLNADQHGLTGSWYNPATSGQGFEIEIYPDVNGAGDGLLFAGWFTYDVTAAGGRRWYALQGPISSASPSAILQIFDEEGGNLNAPPAIATTGTLGVAQLNFNDCSTATLTYTFTDGSARSGTIPLSRLTPNVTCGTSGDNGAAPFDSLLSGNWYDPTTSGQGLMFDFSPSINNVFAAWYTFAPNGQQIGGPASQRWYTLQSNQFVPGVTSLENIPIIETTGGVFDDSAETDSAQVGSAKIAFQSCNAMTFTYQFSSGENQGLSGAVNLQRVGPTPAGCSL